MVKKWIKENILDIIGLLPYVAAVAVVVLAFISKLPPYQIGIVILALFALVFFGINQFKIYRAGRVKGLGKQNDIEIEDTIQNWLTKPGYKFEKKDINDPVFHNDRYFHFEVEDEWGRVVSIARPRVVPTRLDLSSAIYLAPDHKKHYENLNASERKTLIHNLRVEMARFGLVFRGLEGTEPKLERIDFGDSVSLDDNLTEFYLKQRILYMIRAGFLVNELIIRGLGL